MGEKKIQNISQHITQQMLRHQIPQAMLELSIAIQRCRTKAASQPLRTTSSSGFSCKPQCHRASLLTNLGKNSKCKVLISSKATCKTPSTFSTCATPVHWPGYKKSRVLHFEHSFQAASPNGESQLFRSFKATVGLHLFENTFLAILYYPNITRAPEKSNLNI